MYPGLAVAEALRVIEPEAGILFLCTERAIDEQILSESGFSFIPQPIVPLPRKVGLALERYSLPPECRRMDFDYGTESARELLSDVITALHEG